MADPKQSRGYRNKNPGNIDFSPANKWQGQVGLEMPPVAGRARFAAFESHEFGIRALAMLLITYQDRYGLRTVRAIIGRWAPSNENSTDGYVRRVAQMTGFDPDTQALDLHTYAHLRPMVEAIITVELGGQPYAEAMLDAGLRLAGVPRPVDTVPQAAATPTGRGALTVAGLGSAAAVAAPILQATQGLSPWTVMILALAALVGAAVWVLVNRKASA